MASSTGLADRSEAAESPLRRKLGSLSPSRTAFRHAGPAPRPRAAASGSRCRGRPWRTQPRSSVSSSARRNTTATSPPAAWRTSGWRGTEASTSHSSATGTIPSAACASGAATRGPSPSPGVTTRRGARRGALCALSEQRHGRQLDVLVAADQVGQLARAPPPVVGARREALERPATSRGTRRGAARSTRRTLRAARTGRAACRAAAAWRAASGRPGRTSGRASACASGRARAAAAGAG